MRFPFVGNIRRVMADKLKSHGAVGYREKDDIVDSDCLAGRSLPFSKIINEECPRLENYYRGTNNRTFSRDLSSKMAKFVQRLIVLWLITIYYSLLINDNDN